MQKTAVFQDSRVTLFHQNIVLSTTSNLPPKNLWFSTGVISVNLMGKTKASYFFVSRKFSEMVAGTGKGQWSFGYGHKNEMEAGVYFKQKIQSNISF